MKTLKLFLSVLLTIVFFNNTKAQTTEVFTNTTVGASSTSNNGDYALVSGREVGGYEGSSKLLQRNGDGTYTTLKTYQITTTNNENIDVVCNAVCNDGTSYDSYKYAIISDDWYFKVQKNLSSGTSIKLFDFKNGLVQLMKEVGDYLYLILQAGSDFEPIGSNIPNMNAGEYMIIKSDGTPDSYLWAVVVGTDQIKKIQEMPNGNIAITENNNSNDTSHLVEIDSINGNEVNEILSGLDGDEDVYQYTGSYLYKYCKTNVKLYKYNPVTAVTIDSTQWPQHNLWNRGIGKIKADENDNLIFSAGTSVGRLSNNLVHNFVDKFNDVIGDVKSEWINPNESITFVSQDGGSVYLTTVDFEEDESLIPLINEDYSSDILSIHYGKRIDKDGNYVDGTPSEVVLGYATGTLPNDGDPAPNGLMIDPLGPAYFYIIFPFQEIDGTVTVRGVAFDDVNSLHQINLLAYCVGQSTLGIDTELVDKINLKVFPNPVQDVVNISLQKNKNVEEIEIYDALGRKVFLKDFAENSSAPYQLNIAGLHSGIYSLHVYGKFGSITEKIIKK